MFAIYILTICSFLILAIKVYNIKKKQKLKQKLLFQMKETMKKISDG